MEVILTIPWYFWLISVFLFILGFIVCFIWIRTKTKGTIFIEETDEPDHDRIRFVLDLELDDIRKLKILTFKVRNGRSQNSQPV